MPIKEQQTTNKQHAIPQSIMSVEFKIIGDLTLKQFVYLLVFSGLAYASFMLVSAFVVKWLLVIFFAGTGLAFAFLPLGDRGLDAWIVNFLRAMFMPNQYVYRKEEQVPGYFLYQNLDVVKNELITLTPTTSRRKIEAYLQQQEPPKDKLDIDEKEFIMKVRKAYSESSYTQTLEAPTYQADYTSIQAAEPQTAQQSSQQVAQLTQTQPSLEPQTPITLIGPAVKEVAPQKDQKEQEKPKEISEPQQTQTTSQKETSTIETQIPTDTTTQIIRSHAKAHGYKYRQKSLDDAYYSPAITPDMHSGRRFINLAQGAGGGEIVLPMRRERVLKTAEELELEELENQRIKELDELINAVREKEIKQKQVIEQKYEQTTQTYKEQTLTEKEQEERFKKLQEERQKKQQEEKEKAQALAQEQAKLEELKRQEEQLRKQKEELAKKQEEEAKKKEEELQQQKIYQQTVKPQPIPLKPADISENPSMPNIIWGLVTTNYQGAKVGVPGVVVVIRNQKGEVVRAIKTSPQGRFGISTPLINGIYTIEVDKEKRSGLNFALMQVEAKGQLIPTVEIEGRP